VDRIGAQLIGCVFQRRKSRESLVGHVLRRETDRGFAATCLLWARVVWVKGLLLGAEILDCEDFWDLD